MNLISSCTMVVFHMLSGKLPEDCIESQYRLNKVTWREYKKRDPNRYLEGQRYMAGFLYGKASKLQCRIFFGGYPISAALNSCETIATYNALTALGEEVEFPEVLKEYAGRGICFNGIFGTDPLAVREYFRKRGFEVEEYKGSSIEKLKDTGNGETYIFTSFNRGYNPFSMVHTVCVTKEEEGFKLHNGKPMDVAFEDPLTAIKAYNDGKSRVMYIMKIKPKKNI